MIEIKIQKSKRSDNYLLYLKSSDKVYLYDETPDKISAQALMEYTLKYLTKNPISSIDWFTSGRLREEVLIQKIADEKKKRELLKKSKR